MRVVSFGMTTGRMARVGPRRTGRRAPGASLRRPLRFVYATLRQWRQRRRERAELARLDDRMLRDIGVTRADVWHEVNKPFWRP